MKRFKFLFAVSAGLILLFFLAKFVVMALCGAILMGAIFFIARRVKYGLGYVDHGDECRMGGKRPFARFDRTKESLFDQNYQHKTDYLTNYRDIEVL